MGQQKDRGGGAWLCFFLFVGLIGVGGCAPQDETARVAQDNAIIADLQSGLVVRDLSQANAKGAQQATQEATLAQVAEVAQDPPTSSGAAVVATALSTSLCPGVPAAPKGDERFAALSALYDCLRDLTQDLIAWDVAADRYRTQRETAFSGLSLDLLWPRLAAPDLAGRREFEPTDLDELLSIYKRRREAYKGAEAKILGVVEAHSKWLMDLDFAAAKALVALSRVQRQTPDLQYQSLSSALGISVSVEGKKLLPLQFISTYGATDLIPSRGDEFLRTLRSGDTPFDRMVVRAALLEVSSGVERLIRAQYESIRAQDAEKLDTKTLPQVSLQPDAVKVAFIDSGLDYKRHPALGRYLAAGGTDRFGSCDQADGDNNPWEPLGTSSPLGHGSGTAATLLTVLSDLEPNFLRGGRLALGMWKTFSTRRVLAGPFGDMSHLWELKGGAPLAHQGRLIREQLSKPDQPDVISVSMVFRNGSLIQDAASVLKKSTTPLWVMAAGNFGAPVESGPVPGCFDDVPAEHRPSDRIVCVGALKRGLTRDDLEVASYSSHGSRVDVYSLESYFSDLCPNGTSCATPAVSALAAWVKHRLPALTAPEIRQALIAAAEELDVPVQGRPSERRKIRYLNPMLHSGAVLQAAEALLKARPTPREEVRIMAVNTQ